ncbi:hypothetical protein EDC94DRAFT_585911 [Helicostylum pulchrum]|nr:hypothetical protein EDC94DRAFT_585911 [Helicostylum pulchrum]
MKNKRKMGGYHTYYQLLLLILAQGPRRKSFGSRRCVHRRGPRKFWSLNCVGHRRMSYPSVSHMYFHVDNSYATLFKLTWSLFGKFPKHTEGKPFDAEKDELVVIESSDEEYYYFFGPRCTQSKVPYVHTDVVRMICDVVPKKTDYLLGN